MRTCVYGRYAPAQPIINLQSFKSTPDSLKQRFKAFGRKPSLGAPGPLPISIRFYMDFSRLKGRSEGGTGVPVTPLCKRFFFFKKITHNIPWRKRHDDNV